MKEHLVTVIMPVYNAENRLEYAINSVLKQSYKNIEVILIDDGSTDNSVYICNKYEKMDSRIKVIKQNNSGVSAARNRGINESSGEFIMFLDSDDTIYSETIKELISYLDNDESDIAIFGMSFDYYQRNIFKYKKELSFEENATISSTEIKKYFLKLYGTNYLSPVWNKLFKTKIIKDNKIFFEEDMAILEDFKFVLDVIEQSKNITILANVYYHYYNDLSSSKLKRRPNIDYMRNFKILDFKLREFSKKFDLEDEYSYGRINGMIFRYYITAIEKLFIEDTKYKYKCEQLKHLMLDKDFSYAVKNARPNSTKLKIIRFLFKSKSVRILSLIFWVNNIRK